MSTVITNNPQFFNQDKSNSVEEGWGLGHCMVKLEPVINYIVRAAFDKEDNIIFVSNLVKLLIEKEVITDISDLNNDGYFYYVERD